ncbi:MAG: hypothetical protein AAF788_03330 [Pseudomonadota bacterium]
MGMTSQRRVLQERFTTKTPEINAICDARVGFEVFRTVDDVDGYAELRREEGCNETCQVALYTAFDFVESNWSEERARSNLMNAPRRKPQGRSEESWNRYRESTIHNNIAVDPGWYRFVRSSWDDPLTENHRKYLRGTSSYIDRTVESFEERLLENPAIALVPIEGPTARYRVQTRLEEQFYTESRGDQLSLYADEIVDTEAGDVLARSRILIARPADPVLIEKGLSRSMLMCGKDLLSDQIKQVLKPKN